MEKNKLILSLNGSPEPFINYLKNFAKIRSSLLLEIDPFEKMFVAKTYSEDRSAIRFSAISFDECNIVIKKHNTKETNSNNNYRIKLGILLELPNLIKIIERFNTKPETESNDKNIQNNSIFDIIINYDNLYDTSGNTIDYIAENISFLSDILTMKMDGFKPSEFKYLSDEVFNEKIFKVTDSFEFEISANTISNIIKTSDIIKGDPKTDCLIFYVDKKNLYVRDNSDRNGTNIENSELTSNFIYKLGTFDNDIPDYDINLPIFRERFLQIFDKTNENYKIIFGKSVNGVVDRLLFESINSTTKIVISIINKN